jgi:type I restriction enzyme R subunit
MRDALPNACFIGFTGTPLELGDRNTRAVFGDYISIYDIQRAVEDGATVPIYYESRLAKLDLPEEEKPRVDEEFEEVTEGEEVERKERLKTKWARLEAVVGAEKRLRLIAQDIVNHFEQRLQALDGKAMVVCMSRRICVELYKEIVRLRPEWHQEDDDKGVIKVVMTGSASDPPEWQPHIRNKDRREFLAKRFRDPKDPFKIVIVRDMWLTGFDCPSLHTMYVDKPMRAHGLMQAIARVNRVFRDKPGGLVVDYLGLAHEMKQALATYTESGGKGKTALDQAEAVAVMKEKYEVCCDLFHGFEWSRWKRGSPRDPRRRGLLPGRPVTSGAKLPTSSGDEFPENSGIKFPTPNSGHRDLLGLEVPRWSGVRKPWRSAACMPRVYPSASWPAAPVTTVRPSGASYGPSHPPSVRLAGGGRASWRPSGSTCCNAWSWACLTPCASTPSCRSWATGEA